MNDAGVKIAFSTKKRPRRMSGAGQSVDKAGALTGAEKLRKARKQACRHGRFHERKQPQAASAADAAYKNPIESLSFDGIFAFAGFVSEKSPHRLCGAGTFHFCSCILCNDYAAMSAYSKYRWPMALQMTPVISGLTRYWLS